MWKLYINDGICFPGSVKSTSLAPSNAMVTKAPLTGVASTEAVVVAATASAVGYNRSAPDTLVIGLVVSAILLLVVMVPVVMFAVFFCHHRRKRYTEILTPLAPSPLKLLSLYSHNSL